MRNPFRTEAEAFSFVLVCVVLFALVAVAGILGYSGALTGAGLSLRDAGAMWYCAIEAISVTENLGEAGVPLPQVLVDAIAVLKGKGERAT